MSTEVVKMLTSIRSRTLKALPMTPQTSFARVPFSFRREKKPGLYKMLVKIFTKWRKYKETYMPKNLRDFMNEVAFII